MHNIMVDIETCGTRPNCPILSIGACKFDPGSGEIGKTFYRAISPADAFLNGVADGNTFKWWMEQSDAARKAAVAGTTLLGAALADLTDFHHDWPKAEVWANDPDFDVTILNYGYHRTGQAAPWAFWNTRSCRTIAKLAGKWPPKIGGAGTHHNALDDAVHQAKWVSDFWRQIKGIGTARATVADERLTSRAVLDDL